VHIDLWFDGTSPPSGRVAVSAEEQQFQGWLELMRLLSEALDGDAASGARHERLRGVRE
jgi:hypothetical protein